jgi:hypothetical protein
MPDPEKLNLLLLQVKTPSMFKKSRKPTEKPDFPGGTERVGSKHVVKVNPIVSGIDPFSG